MSRLRTYSHLQGARRVPDEYDIGTSQLLHHTGDGFEVQVPVLPWYQKHAHSELLQSNVFERFADPERTTYRKYTEIRAKREAFVGGLFDSMEASGYDARLSSEWLDVLERVLPVLRYPAHGLQMASAYVAHLAPSGRWIVSGLLQCGDELRRVQLFARRMHQLRAQRPDFGNTSADAWQTAPQWQPLRKLVEELLVTYELTEAFVALNLGVKPVFDAWFGPVWAETARAQGDPVLAQLLDSLDEDAASTRSASLALLTTWLQARAGDAAHIASVSSTWRARAMAAVGATAELIVPKQRVAFLLSELESACAHTFRAIDQQLSITGQRPMPQSAS